MKTYLARDGAPLKLRVLGRGRPVVLLHGLGASGGQWLPFIWPHLSRYRFYIPDLRAMGKSAAAGYNQPDIFQNHMEDLQDLISHFGLSDILLGGHSLGSSVALHWQRAGGFRHVRGYLHIDQSPCVPNREDWTYGVFGPDQTRVFAALAQLREMLNQHAACEDLAGLPLPVRTQALRIIGEAFSRVTGRPAVAPLLPWLARSPRLLKRHFPVLRLADLDKLLNSYLNAHDYRDSLRDCQTPLRVFVGMRSPIYHPAGQMSIAELAAQGEVVRFPRAGHLPPFEQPLLFSRQFGRFLSSA